MSPTQLTLRELRKRGYKLVQVVEHWNPHVNRRVDLFGVIDVIAVGERGDMFEPTAEVVMVQTTSDTNVPARVKKIRESGVLPVLSSAGVTVLAHGWRKRNGQFRLRELELAKRGK